MEQAAQQTPLPVTLALSAVAGLVLTGALFLWLKDGPTILFKLQGLSAAFICF